MQLPSRTSAHFESAYAEPYYKIRNLAFASSYINLRVFFYFFVATLV